MRLKKRHMLMGLWVAAATVSCSNDQVIDDLRPAGGNETDGISFVVADQNTRGGSFGNRPGSSTRASVTTEDNINTAGNAFAVYGDMTSDSKTICLFNGEEVKCDGNDWSYSNIRYWFLDREFSFTALYPQNFSGLSDLSYENNRLAFTYTLDSDYTKATDILTAGHRRTATSTNVRQMVELNFSHILTQLNFVAKIESTSQNSGIEIKEITIKGVVSGASYSILPADIQNGSTETSDLAISAWEMPQTPERVSLTKTTSATNVVKTTQNKTTSISLFPTDKDPLLVIPQKVTGDLVVQITYTQTGKGTVSLEGRLDSTSIAQWNPGKSYTYSFTISDNNYIVFDQPELKDWDEADGSSYIIMN